MSGASSSSAAARLVEIDAMLEHLQQLKEDTVRMIVLLQTERNGIIPKSSAFPRELSLGNHHSRKSHVACR